ncbi:hypothetical protein [Williamsia serinedens]|uniref:Mce-associated membrane protein n=1 Tax=Williamsia serinedens TaxID=391736 RepID=A0ABT1H0A1_9NOCA|nr:hypothetical protein [Williamsia serinedens]MCP2160671.1 hypothetical protein [Williamsia serinedens]
MATDDQKDGGDDTASTPTETSDTATTETSDTATTGTAGEKPATTTDPASSRRPRLLVGVLAGLVVILAVVAGVAVYYASSYRSDYTTLRDANSDAQRAEDVASDYAVKAALIDYRDFDPWFAALRTNVDDKMRQQFTSSESVLRQLLGQLQWVSKGDLVGSDIKSQNNGVYVVQVFVDVQVTNVQSPGGVKTTALYPITVDRNKKWTITDISGGVAPLAQATAPN